VLKKFYYSPRPCGQPKDNKFARMVPTILSSWDLDVQQGLFKLTMKSNIAQAMVEIVALAFNKVFLTIINLLTCTW
jgi:hypothetical protein